MVERPNIIHTDDMVIVFMGKEDGIQVSDVCPKHLLPKIRTSIDENVPVTVAQEYRRPEPIVVRVVRDAYVTLATYDRYSLRCSSAE
jgi:hypothetical protein